jgi:hypothetical protein
MHDPRIGRFFAIDPMVMKYPYYSPYHFSSNSPIISVELEGLESSVQLNYPEVSITIVATLDGRLLITAEQIALITKAQGGTNRYIRGASGSWGIKDLVPGGSWEIGCSNCGFRGAESGFVLLKLPTEEMICMEPVVIPAQEEVFENVPVEVPVDEPHKIKRSPYEDWGDFPDRTDMAYAKTIMKDMKVSLKSKVGSMEKIKGKFELSALTVYAGKGVDIKALTDAIKIVFGNGIKINGPLSYSGSYDVSQIKIVPTEYTKKVTTIEMQRVKTQDAVPEHIEYVEKKCSPVVVAP